MGWRKSSMEGEEEEQKHRAKRVSPIQEEGQCPLGKRLEFQRAHQATVKTPYKHSCAPRTIWLAVLCCRAGLQTLLRGYLATVET